ncbi:class I SAM-dependent DNA methyltransferase [Nannocystaceae bacterium ST9]
MPLSWNEIKSRALAFSKEWADEESERAEAKSFWDAFFNVFGITRRRVASFEKPIKKSDGKGGFIDLLWKGMLLVEHKSKGKDLERAFQQAIDYFPGLKERDLPRYVLVSDFERFKLIDLEEDKSYEFKLGELHDNVGLFAFIAGYETRSYGEQDPANIKAAETLGRLHDQLEAVGYDGHPLEIMLVRLLFCLFAEDTAIFDRRRQFQEYLETRTAEDGSDLGMHLAHLFQVLNQQQSKRLKNLDEQLAAFPYVNGKLFEEVLPVASFDREMREVLLDCCGLNWSRISPAIFGSLFQSIMDKEERRNLGAHYTTETNILKVLDTLMLDGLRSELEKVKGSKGKLEQFLVKLAEIRVLDPACGCGNFLVIAYREIRRIEIDALKALMKSGQLELDATRLIRVNVDQFFGIEIEEFPAQIAQVALWLTDHQENLRASAEFGLYYARLPLSTAPNILNGNALMVDWESVIAPDRLSFIVGNPPFLGKKEQSGEQKNDMKRVFPKLKGVGKLDYVSCWFMKAARYAAKNKNVTTAFVSTSSVTQGEQVGILWGTLFSLGVKINFAHRTFQWTSEARGKAAVHCVIIGFGYQDAVPKFLFEYDTPKGEPHSRKVSSINAYLVDGPNVLLHDRATPLGTGLEVTYGSFALDDGQYTLTPQDRSDLLAACPASRKFIKHFIGGKELIHSKERFCLWLVDATPNDIKAMPEVAARIDHVRKWRAKSSRPETVALAATPTLFAEMRQPATKYLAFPTLSSENRVYIPIDFLAPSVIASNQVYVFEGATLYHFGVLTSDAHMTWIRAVCGRLESRYRYSAGIVYNNFPWPSPDAKQRALIETKAQGVLAARAIHRQTSLAQLYDKITMPPNLVKAHRELDKAVYAAYGISAKKTEAERAAILFELHEKLAAPTLLTKPEKPSGKKPSDKKPNGKKPNGK